MENPFLKRTRVLLHGRKAEKRTAKRLDGQQRPGSGSIAGAKGDISLASYLVENKSTEHKSIGIKYQWLHKISNEALAEGKEPALAIQFVNFQGKPIAKDASWVCVPERVFNEVFKNSGSKK